MEKSVVKTPETSEIPTLPKELEEYKTRQVLLEDGARTLIKAREFIIGSGADAVLAWPGKKIRVKDGDLSFAGVVEDDKSQYNLMPVGKLADEELYRALSPDDLDRGIFLYEAEELEKNINEQIPQSIMEYCKM